MTFRIDRAWRACLLAAAGAQLASSGAALAQFARPPLSPVEKMVDNLKASRMPRTDRVRPPLPADAPMPSADPRDFSGTWMHLDALIFRNLKDMYGLDIPFNEAGIKVLTRRIDGNAAGTPYINASAICRPPGPIWQLDLNFPFQIFQSKNWMEWVFEEYHGQWNILLDPSVPTPKDKPYMGVSTGHWEGDTLVVETKDFRQDMWIDVDGAPLSAAGKLTSRIRKVSRSDRGPYLEVLLTIDDPTYYMKPWTIARAYHWRPNRVVMKEYNCEEQVGYAQQGPDAGLVPEPKQ